MKNAETPVFKLVLFGAESSLGNALTTELLARQHEVIAVVDDLNRHTPRPGLHLKIGALDDADQVEQGAAGGSAVIALLAPGDLAAQARMSEALMAGLARTTIRRLLLVGDFDVLDVPGDYGEAERECADQVVDGLQRSALRWTLINRPRTLADEGLARVAAGMVDILELDLHRGEHLNFVV
ncbi:TPA: NAD(P)H-binding protein [Pseudomonas putida]|uniref:NAD(P)-dependent oxidoreductase n=1 Tax=Pseudomonas TaxID=286 RepID=UPI00048613B0|nr:MULTISPECIES: NAD(P)H-binding protein [Pseudomonas]MDD2150546.1 SDR family oxidoreductase [Pseudomonas putida]RAS29483.1 putative NADH-flavin reductase [Pseudomonas sp. URMO17WK12:I7]SMF12601.1 Putative NADH-flavin reductase [Pseudomonas sp. URMO17WK12:I5]HDS1678620.1 NAD(P)H-binding protein [Pseudomonas putida]